MFGNQPASATDRARPGLSYTLVRAEKGRGQFFQAQPNSKMSLSKVIMFQVSESNLNNECFV